MTRSVCLVVNRTSDGGHIAFVAGDQTNAFAIAPEAGDAVLALIRSGRTPVEIKVLPPRANFSPATAASDEAQ